MDNGRHGENIPAVHTPNMFLGDKSWLPSWLTKWQERKSKPSLPSLCYLLSIDKFGFAARKKYEGRVSLETEDDEGYRMMSRVERAGEPAAATVRGATPGRRGTERALRSLLKVDTRLLRGAQNHLGRFRDIDRWRRIIDPFGGASRL